MSLFLYWVLEKVTNIYWLIKWKIVKKKKWDDDLNNFEGSFEK